jgi:hypothetical protein
MRIDTKLNALQSVTENGQFTLEHEYILNNQYVKIQNWSDVCTALRVLREVDWMGDDSNRQLLDDYLENRGEGDTLEVPNGEFQSLQQAVQRYDHGLDIILNTLRAHAVSTSEDTIWVEIRSASDPAELADIVQQIRRALNIAGQTGAPFRFAGVAQGSDWLGFIPNSELVGIALNYCISLAASISAELLRVSGPVMVTLARRDLRRSEDDSPSQAAVNARLREIKEEAAELMTEEGVQKFIERLATSNYSREDQNQIAAAMRATTASIQKMAETDTARFEVSEEGKEILIEIHGDNNQITIQNFPEIPRRSEALPSAESDSGNDSDNNSQ